MPSTVNLYLIGVGSVSASSRVPGGRLPRGSWDGSSSLSDLDPWFVLSRTGLAPHGAAAPVRVADQFVFWNQRFSEPIPLPKGASHASQRRALIPIVQPPRSSS